MSEVHYLGRLLDGVVVGWKALGDVIKLEKGRQLNKELLSDHGLYPAYNGGITHSGFTDSFNYTENKTIISQGGASAGFVNFVRSKFYANAHCYVVLPNTEIVSNRYVYHVLKLNQNRLTEKQHGAGIPALRTSEILEISIPIPCPENPPRSLAIQAELVRILDTFAELTAELTTELTAELATRKKQYHHYRDQLLRFQGRGVEWKPLGDIGNVRMCKRILKNETHPEGDVPFYKIGTFGKQANAFISSDLYESYKAKYPFPKMGDVLISASGTIGRAVVYDGKPAYFQDSNIVWLDNDESTVSNRYLSHFYRVAKWFVSEGGTIDRLYNENILKTKVPVPYPNDPKKSLAEQARVVALLDKFDALTCSLSESLAHEVELRHHQYAYYRDLLLSFRKSEELVG